MSHCQGNVSNMKLLHQLFYQVGGGWFYSVPAARRLSTSTPELLFASFAERRG